jgi:hypothetical protein
MVIIQSPFTPVRWRGPCDRTDVPGLCADRVHRADTLDGHLRGFDGPDAQVVHARLAAIVMNDDPPV